MTCAKPGLPAKHTSNIETLWVLFMRLEMLTVLQQAEQHYAMHQIIKQIAGKKNVMILHHSERPAHSIKIWLTVKSAWEVQWGRVKT